MHSLKPAALIALTSSALQNASACDVCSTRQPAILQELTHGLGPSGIGDYLLPAMMAVVMFYALFRSIQCLGPRAERPYQRIKREVLSHGVASMENE